MGSTTQRSVPALGVGMYLVDAHNVTTHSDVLFIRYLFDVAHEKLTEADIENLRTFPDHRAVDSACALAWDEAAAICKVLLGISPPALPVQPDVVATMFAAATSTDASSDDLVSGTESAQPSPQDLDDEEVDVEVEAETPAESDPTSQSAASLSQAMLGATRTTARLHALDQELHNAREAAEEVSAEPANPTTPLIPAPPLVKPDIINLINAPSKILSPDSITPIIEKMVASRFAAQSSSRVRSEVILTVNERLQQKLRALEGQFSPRYAIAGYCKLIPLLDDSVR